MGYHKQEEIAGQVEEADRVPRPRSAVEHAVFFPERRMRRHAEKQQHDKVLPWIVVMWAATMFMMGATLGIVL